MQFADNTRESMTAVWFSVILCSELRNFAVKRGWSGPGRLEGTGLEQRLQLFTTAATEFVFAAVMQHHDVFAVEMRL